jgi:Uma2 family endonuclease
MIIPGSLEETVAEITPDPTSDPAYDEASVIASLIDDDGEPMAVSEVHRRALIYFWSLLDAIKELYQRIDMYIGGDSFWHYDRKDLRKYLAPDAFVIFGVENAHIIRNRWIPWYENNRKPSFILEMASKSTYENDLTDKKDKYELQGVEEYFLFDLGLECFDVPLKAFRLQDGKYQELIPDERGAIYSETLNVWLIPEGTTRLEMIDGVTGLRILGDSERAEVERQKTVAERQRVDAEQQRADAEQQRADAEKQRADQAETMIQKLQEMLRSAGIDPKTSP